MNSLQTIPAAVEEVVLVRYERANRALDDAVAVDEVLEVRDEAERLRLYTKQAKDTTLELKAVTLRERAERKLGEMIAAQREAGALNPGTAGAGRPSLGGGKNPPPKIAPPTLAEVGIDKDLAKQARKMFGLSDEEFEARQKQREQEAQETGRVRIEVGKSNVVPIRSPEQERRFMKHLEDQLDEEEDDGGSFLLTATPQQKASSYNGWMTGLPLLNPDPALIVADLLHVTNPAHVAEMEKVVDLNLEIAAKIKEIFDVRKHSLR